MLTLAKASPLAVAPRVRIPGHQMDMLARLPDAAKDDYYKLADAVRDILAAPRGSIVDKVSFWSRKLNCSEGHLRRRLAAYRNGTRDYPAGDWRILVNHSKAGPDWWNCDLVTLPAEFVEYCAKLLGDNQRAKLLTQHRELLRRWKRWQQGDPDSAIPGYDVCPPAGPNGHHPSGWSYENIRRAVLNRPLARTELMLVTLGTAAAIKTLPGIPGTRVGARPLEWVIFDDVWLDRKVLVPGWRMPLRMLQLGCLDYASGVYLRFGQQPELWNDDQSRERLREQYTRWLIASLLETCGYPREYKMNLVLERGTATVRPADARALFDLTGGQVVCHYTSMEGELVTVWEERGTGNSRGKAPLESWHNLFHNECATLRGQMGKDREHSPANLLGQERHAIALQTASALLSPEQRAQLRLPFADREQCYEETLAIVDRINRRTEHDLEGFDDVLLWRIAGVPMDWQPESALLDKPQLLAHPELLEYDKRKESPAERFSRLFAGVPVDHPGTEVLKRFYQDSHVIEQVAGLKFEFKRDGKTLRFEPPTAAEAIPDGTKLLGYYNPWEPDYIHLCDLDGRYVATWPRVVGMARGDQEQLAKRIARKRSFFNTAMANVRRQRAQEIQQTEADLRHNQQILSDAGLVLPDGDGNATPARNLPPVARALQRANNAIAKAEKDGKAAAAAHQARLDAEPDDFRALDADTPAQADTEPFGVSMDELRDL